MEEGTQTCLWDLGSICNLLCWHLHFNYLGNGFSQNDTSHKLLILCLIWPDSNSNLCWFSDMYQIVHSLDLVYEVGRHLWECVLKEQKRSC